MSSRSRWTRRGGWGNEGISVAGQGGVGGGEGVSVNGQGDVSGGEAVSAGQRGWVGRRSQRRIRGGGWGMGEGVSVAR